MQDFATGKAALGRALHQLTRFFEKNCKAVRIMKITGILLMAACLQVSAMGVTQTVTISVRDVPLLKVLSEIKKQTGYTFFADNKELQKAKNVSITAKNLPLIQVLDLCFKDQPLTYHIIDKVINIVVKEEKSAVVNSQLFIDTTSIRGRVTDENGDPVQASITVKGSNQGTTTNDNGEFLMKGIDDKAILIFSGIGLVSTEVKLNGKKMLTITVKNETTPLQETIIKGYYSTTRVFNTGNVSKVKAEELSKQPISDPIASLQGRVPGLFIKQDRGAPGTTFTVNLRGQNSIANNSNPLFIVDGVPFISTPLNSSTFSSGAGNISPLNSLNLSDIESIEILKDADATSIYGSRGANGVVLITTKKGKIGSSSLNLNVYTGMGVVTQKLDWMNTEQYLTMRREAFKNDNRSVGLTDYDLNGKWDTTRYTDWQNVFIGGTSHVNDAQLSFSGGTSKTQFNLASSYRKETTVFPSDFFDKKISVHYGLSHSSSNNKFNLNLLASYVNNNNQLPTEDLTSYIKLAPNAPALHDELGNLNWQGNTFNNPFALLNQRAKVITNNLITSSVLSYKLFSGLSIKASLGYNNIRMKQNRLFPLSSFSPQAQQPTNRSNQMSNNSIQSWIVEPQLNYDKSFGNSKINILIGSTFQENLQESLSQTASNFSNDYLIENIQAATSLITHNYNYTQYRYNALYGRLGYTFKNQYVLNLTGRRDGSSRFGPGKQFGNFGAIGAAWIFSEQKFIKDKQKILSFGKLRASYGTTGNDQLVPYQYLSSYSSVSYSYQGLTGLSPSRLTNPNFQWEEIKKLEAGLELGFLENRINFIGSWYRYRTSNQLVGYSLPSTTGFTSIQYNLPAVIQNNGWEFEVNTTNIKNRDFVWSTNFNLSIPKNILLSYPNIEGSSYSTRYEVGKSLFVLYYFRYLGIDQSTGRYTFEDKDNDGSVTYEGDRSFFFSGPKYHGGIQNNISYKQWDLSFLFQYVKQIGVASLYNSTPGRYLSGNGNQPLYALRRWQKQDDEALVQKYTTISSSTQEYFDASNGRIKDASYIRLKNLSISWRAPQRLVQKARLKNLRLFVQGQNLLTITNFEGVDPEAGSVSTLPPIKMLTAGFQISL